MFAAPLAIVTYALIKGRWQLVTVIAEFESHRQSREAFIAYFVGHFAMAGDDRFVYCLAETVERGIVRDYYTKDCLDFGGTGGAPPQRPGPDPH
ncbi:hypothetical protein [Lewinella sp. IMCC34191]|uniref:hypothetical protein n=1 Tax=Lewinella sp. IMCC34191 TaxID=2259172 RepID=UPI000E2770EB|nr:hypothetical protein [Lewinella sp. IMCC34191]